MRCNGSLVPVFPGTVFPTQLGNVRTDAWKHTYRARAGIEGTIHQVTAVTGIRQARYTGLGKVSLEHAFAAAAINLMRLNAWWTDTPLQRTPTTHLSRLDLTLAA
jgi:hypothetical protein